MFALSWVFLAAAIGALVFGLSQEGLTFIYVSIAASVLAMLFMLAGVLRRPVRPATAGAPYGPPPEEAARRPEPVSAAAARTGERPARRTTRAPATRPQRKAASTRPTSKTAAARPSAAAATEAPAEAAAATASSKRTTAKKPAAKKTTAKKTTAARSTSDRAQVLALPERGTYHLGECRIVKGRRDTEKITRGTAKRRGYSACGICKPAA